VPWRHPGMAHFGRKTMQEGTECAAFAQRARSLRPLGPPYLNGDLSPLL
jgi:hypothetical protein